jgi:hypothetical protein
VERAIYQWSLLTEGKRVLSVCPMPVVVAGGCLVPDEAGWGEWQLSATGGVLQAAIRESGLISQLGANQSDRFHP